MRNHLPKHIFALLFTLTGHLGIAQLDLTLTVTQQPTCADPTGGMIAATIFNGHFNIQLDAPCTYSKLKRSTQTDHNFVRMMR